MKILIAASIFPPDIGGPATYSFRLAREMTRRGFIVRIVSYGHSKKILPKGIRHLVYFLHIFFASFSCDVIYAQNAVSAGLPAILVAKILQRKSVIKIVGDAAWERAREKNATSDELDDFQAKKYSWNIELLRGVQKLTTSNADAIITPSLYLKDIVKGWGVDGNKINVVYNSTDAETQSDYREIGKEQAQENIGLKGNIVLSIGRLVSWKGFDKLIEIMPDLIAQNPHWKLVVVGSGPLFEDLRSKIEDLKLTENIELVGTVSHDKLALYFGAADMFVLNSSYEGLSHVLLESMAHGVPIVATNVGGNPELIEDGVNGFLVEKGDLYYLKNKIMQLHNNESLRKKFVENSYNKIKTFSFDSMIEKTMHILKYTNKTL